MPAIRISSSELPEKMFGLQTPNNLFQMGVALDGVKYYAFRAGSPMFVVEGYSREEVYSAASDIIEGFLNKMYRYGFRT